MEDGFIISEPQSTKLSIAAMATRFELLLYGSEQGRLRSAGEEALEEIARLNDQLSAFRPESEVTYINTHAHREDVRVEPCLFRLLMMAKEIHHRTEDAFDITVGPLLKCWGLAGGQGRVPSDDDLAAARAVVGMEHVLLDEQRLTVRFDREGVRLDLGAIGKGYALERASDLLREAGIQNALIHCGTSTVQAIGPQPDGSPWRIMVEEPTGHSEKAQVVGLIDSALSVSSSRGKWFEADGKVYGHVIDPRTGTPISTELTVVVIGPSPTLCDALSTALVVLGDSGINILHRSWPEYKCQVSSDE